MFLFVQYNHRYQKICSLSKDDCGTLDIEYIKIINILRYMLKEIGFKFWCKETDFGLVANKTFFLLKNI